MSSHVLNPIYNMKSPYINSSNIGSEFGYLGGDKFVLLGLQTFFILMLLHLDYLWFIMFLVMWFPNALVYDLAWISDLKIFALSYDICKYRPPCVICAILMLCMSIDVAMSRDLEELLISLTLGTGYIFVSQFFLHRIIQKPCHS